MEKLKELEKVEQQISKVEEGIKSITIDSVQSAPKENIEPINDRMKISQKEMKKTEAFALHAIKTIGCRDKFNEKFRAEYEFKKQRVKFTAEHREIGETIEFWTRPYGGMDAEFWQVPVNKLVEGPRYVAEQIKGCVYSQFIMDQSKVTSGGDYQFTGQMVVEKRIQRLDATPYIETTTVGMASNF
jgi:hypothetical protein